MRVVKIVDAVGNALILQLCFALCAIPMVTIIPAAVALQRSLDDYRTGEQTGLRPFLKQLRRAWTQYGRLSLISVPLAVAWTASLVYWASAGSGIGWIAVGVMIFWSGFGAAVYVALLAASTTSPHDTGRAALRSAVSLVAARPLCALAGLVLLGSWLLLLGTFPTLALVGSGLIPALIARFTLADRLPGTASGSPGAAAGSV